MKRLLIYALPGFALCVATMAQAQQRPQISATQVHRMMERLQQADANRDGFITRQEWLNYRAAQFSRLDRNDDGYLDQADVPVFLGNGKRGQMLQQALLEFDQNHDGRVNRDEFVNGPAPVFDKIDLDRNGVIDAFEMKQAQTYAEGKQP